LLLEKLPEIELHHREKEGSLPIVKAPKDVIGHRKYDGNAVGIKKATMRPIQSICYSNYSAYRNHRK